MKKISLIIILIIGLLMWAPWMNDTDSVTKKVIDKYGPEYNLSYGETDECCYGYKNDWIPFGRVVTHEENSWHIFFWE